MSRLNLTASLLGALLFASGASGVALDAAQTESRPAKRPSVEPAPVAQFKTAPASRAADRQIVLQEGEEVVEALLRSGISAYDSAKAEMALGDVAMHPGRRVAVWLGGDLSGGARVLVRLEVRGPGDTVHLVSRNGDDFEARVERRPVDDTPVRLTFEAGPSAAATLAAAGLPSELRATTLQAIAGGGEGKVDLLVAHEEVGSTGQFGQLLGVSLTREDGIVRRWLGDGAGQLALLDPGEGMVRPVSGRVSSSPGLRVHPILRFLRWHRGTDFAALRGTPVLAAMDGVVEQSGWQGGYGNLVRLRHGDGSTTAYAHLSQVDVSVGRRVAQGTALGRVGDTGLATGPHLHFEWLREGRVLHPTFAAGNAMPAHDAVTRARLQRMLATPYRTLPVGGTSAGT